MPPIIATNNIEQMLQSEAIELSEDGFQFRVQIPVHPDNIPILEDRLTEENGKYFSAWFNVEDMHTTIALEGPIFRAGPQLVLHALLLNGLEEGYLCADSITFAEEYDNLDYGAEDVRERIHNNWKNVIENSNLTIAMAEYGLGSYDPGVVIGSIAQLAQGNPILSIAIEGPQHRDDIFSNTFDQYHITPKDVNDIIYGKGDISERILETAGKLDFLTPLQDKQEKEYDILIIHEYNIEGFATATNVSKRFQDFDLESVKISDIAPELPYEGTLYDLNHYISKSRHVVVLGDDSAEPGLLGSSAIALSKELGVPVDMLRGDFRAVTGEGRGGGINQPDCELGVANMMVEYHFLDNKIHTRVDALASDIKNDI